MAVMIDILIIGIILLCTFLGYKKGLIKVAVGILGFFIAIIIALILYNPIANFVITNTNIKTNLKESISGTVKSYVIKEENVEKKEEQEPEIMVNYINTFIEKEKQNVVEGEKQLIDNVSEELAINIIKIGVAIAVFLISKIALLFVRILADIIGKLPIIGQFNKLGGTIYGILQGLLIIYIILAIISLVAPTVEKSTILEGIKSSVIGNMMYNNNIILSFIFR